MELKKVDDSASSPIEFVKHDPDRIRALIVQYFYQMWIAFHVETEGFYDILLMDWHLGLKCHTMLLYK